MARPTVSEAIVSALRASGKPESWESLTQAVNAIRGGEPSPQSTVQSTYSQLNKKFKALGKQLPQFGPGRGRRGVDIETLADMLPDFE